MDATTMEAAPLPPVEAAGEAPAAAAAPVWKVLQGAGWFGLGLIALAVEGTGWLIKKATQKGKQVAPSVAKPIKAAGGSVEEALGGVGARLKGVGKVVGRRAGAIEHAVDDRIAAAAERAGAPLASEMGELKTRVDELSKKIESLQARRDAAV